MQITPLSLGLCLPFVSVAAGQVCPDPLVESTEIYRCSAFSVSVIAGDDYEFVSGGCGANTSAIGAATGIFSDRATDMDCSTCIPFTTVVVPTNMFSFTTSENIDSDTTLPCSSQSLSQMNAIYVPPAGEPIPDGVLGVGVSARGEAGSGISSRQVTSNGRTETSVEAGLVGFQVPPGPENPIFCANAIGLGGAFASASAPVFGVSVQPRVQNPTGPRFTITTNVISTATRGGGCDLGSALSEVRRERLQQLLEGLNTILRNVGFFVVDNSSPGNPTVITADQYTFSPGDSLQAGTSGVVFNDAGSFSMSSTSVDTTSDSLSLSFVLLEFGLDDFDIDGDGRFSSLDLALVDAAGDLATTTDPMVVSYFDLDGDGMIENSAPSGGGFFAGSSPGTEIEVAMKTIANMRIVLAADYEAGVFGDLDGDDDADCDDLAIGETGYPFVSLGNALYNTRFDVDLDGVIDQNDREAFFDLLQPGDVTTTGSSLPGGPGFGIPDGVVDLDDLGWYLSRWLALDPVADLTTAGATLPSQPGAGIPDGQVTLDDLGYFQTIWLGSCP